MGFFSDIAIDQRDRDETGRLEWAVLLDDEKRPAHLWRVIGTARGFTHLMHARTGEVITRPDSDVWIVA